MDDDLDAFGLWLKQHKLLAYLPALEEQGYDDLIVLCSLTDDELRALVEDIDMKPGHRRKVN